MSQRLQKRSRQCSVCDMRFEFTAAEIKAHALKCAAKKQPTVAALAKNPEMFVRAIDPYSRVVVGG